MTPRGRSVLAQVGSFVLAGVLLYLALRGVDLREVGTAIGQANYLWLLPLVVVALLSHLLRAWRWQVLIKALPEVETAGRVPSIRAAFYSVMIGYMVNYAAPRLGEIARTANLSAQSRLTFSSLFGTVVVERILDMFVLAAAVASVFFLLIDRFATIDQLFLAPIAVQLGRIPAIATGAAVLGLAVLVAVLYRQILRQRKSAAYRFWNERALPILGSFRDGMMTLLRSRHRAVIIATTAAIWFLYLLMAYVPFKMLGLADAFGISLLDTWSIMILGAIGVVIPSPGGTGSYHYITIQTLVYLFAVSHEAAATYAVLTHAAQLVLYVIVGAVCLVLQGSGFRALRKRTLAAQEENAP